jgi:acyl carrier protein
VKYEDVLSATQEILKAHAKVDRAIVPTDHIQSDLGLDSLEVMEVVADVEDRFAVEVPTATLEKFVTVADVARALTELKQTQLR